MKTITNNMRKISIVAGLALPMALLAGCGGGGSGPSPSATPTPTRTGTPVPTRTGTPVPVGTGTPAPTPTSASTTQAVGTYTGTYTAPNTTGGTFILRVQADGTATGVFNEGVFDQMITAPGTVNLATGQITLVADFDASLDSTQPDPTHLTLSGTANATGASGQFVATNAAGTKNGTFTTAKSSTSPTAVPQPLVKGTTKSGLKKGRL